MKQLKKINAIESSLLLHELGYLVLVLVTAGVGFFWASAWQNSSEEALRLTAMNNHVQTIRGELYRQLKEVFDAVFLFDEDAEEEYLHYSESIELRLKNLALLHSDEKESEATQHIEEAYDNFQQQTQRLLTLTKLTPEQRYLLDGQLEKFTFTELEIAFRNYEALILKKQNKLEKEREDYTTRLIWLLPIPVVIALSLLIFSRQFVKKRVIRPLSAVMKGAKQISHGDLEHSIPEKGVDELMKLAQAINTMAVELVENRDKLIEAKKQAALGELIPLVAHNIRNPLAGIRAASQVTLDEQIPEATKDALKDIIIAVDRLERWVTSLLTYLHPINPHFSDASLPKLVADVFSLITLQVEEKNLTLQLIDKSDNAMTLSLDCNLMEQAIFNLLQNAIEASPIRGEITVEYRESENFVQLIISDQGKGINFDPVSEAVVDGEAKRLGCGLGIPFAIKVLKQHGGTLSYSQVLPNGTSVIISLPTIRKTIQDEQQV